MPLSRLSGFTLPFMLLLIPCSYKRTYFMFLQENIQCDAIKQNDSEVTFVVFYIVWQCNISRKPHEICKLDPEIQAIDGLQNNRKQRAFSPFVWLWLYLKINTCKFFLVLLDHITNFLIFQNKNKKSLSLDKSIDFFTMCKLAILRDTNYIWWKTNLIGCK